MNDTNIPDRYATSKSMLERAQSVIPLGSQTFSKAYTQYPRGAAPHFLERGDRGRVWDVDGNEYVDLICGLLPVVLGYCDPDVDAAITAQLEKGISFSLATGLEIELAERLVDIIPSAEMVRFGKNGTDATSAAVRLARAHTGRDRIAIGGYHGWQDWYIGATVRNKGVPHSIGSLTHRFPFGDLDALKALFKQHPGEFAGVILEPVVGGADSGAYLAAAKSLVHQEGAVLIFDEVISGFRIAMGGGQSHFGVTPDLSAFGKAMANGMPLAAIVGREEIMRHMEEVFWSSTFGGEALSLAAAIAVIDKMRRENVIESLWRKGDTLGSGVETLIAHHNLGQAIGLAGLAPWKQLSFGDHPKARKEAIKTFFIREMLNRDVLIMGSHNVCYAHNDADIQLVLAAYGGVFAALAEQLEQDGFEERLGCPVIEPVFSVRSNPSR